MNAQPVIKGHGLPPGDSGHTGGCIMDWAVWRLSGGVMWADNHPCFNRPVSRMAQRVNDLASPRGRERLDRDFGGEGGRIDRARACRDSTIEVRINRRLALWCARRVEHLTDDSRVKECNDAVERYLAGQEPRRSLIEHEVMASAAASIAQDPPRPFRAASAAARAASYAASAVLSADGGSGAPAAYAALAVSAGKDLLAGDDALLDLLSDFLDAHEKIAADEGALADLWTWDAYCQANGS